MCFFRVVTKTNYLVSVQNRVIFVIPELFYRVSTFENKRKDWIPAFAGMTFNLFNVNSEQELFIIF